MKKNHAKVLHFDLYGKRENKYDFLIDNNIKSINWNELNPTEPALFFVVKNNDDKAEYENGFSVSELFIINGVGLTTAHDEFVIKEKREDLLSFFKDFQNTERNADILHSKFNVKKKEGWNILQGYDNIKNENDLTKYITPISYRPFDNRYVFYENKLVWRTVRKVMQHFLNGDNVGLIFRKQQPDSNDLYVFSTNKIIADGLIRSDNKGGESTAPLYLYPESSGQQELETSPNPSKGGELKNVNRKPNLNMEIVGRIAERLGLAFVAEKNNSPSTEGVAALANGVVSYSSFAPIDILDYIYAVLHSPTYREKYKEFLKIDFPRVPYPKDAATFWELVKLGGEIRQIHLLESPIVEKYITQYPIDGNNVVTKPKYQDGKVYINDSQYFGNVPQIAWEFYIGGYQPAQKWLKDRKDRKLEFDDILHYQKIIVALTETDRIMKEIDKIEIE